jgi:hypothetical protein
MSLFNRIVTLYPRCAISDSKHINGVATFGVVTHNFGTTGSSGNIQYQTVGTVYDLRHVYMHTCESAVRWRACG